MCRELAIVGTLRSTLSCTKLFQRFVVTCGESCSYAKHYTVIIFSLLNKNSIIIGLEGRLPPSAEYSQITLTLLSRRTRRKVAKNIVTVTLLSCC